MTLHLFWELFYFILSVSWRSGDGFRSLTGTVQLRMFLHNFLTFYGLNDLSVNWDVESDQHWRTLGTDRWHRWSSRAVRWPWCTLFKQLNPNLTVLGAPSQQSSVEKCVSRSTRPNWLWPPDWLLLTRSSPSQCLPLLSKVNTLAPSRNADSLLFRVLRERLGQSPTPLMFNPLECDTANTSN